MRVLIVDDSIVFRSQIKVALEGAPGVEIAGSANNGKIALDKIVQGSVDLVILDVEMPEMSGLETLREIKRRGLTPKVLMFSSHTKQGSETTLEALSAGAVDFVTKPNDADLSLENAAARIRERLVPRILQFAGTAAPHGARPPVSDAATSRYTRVSLDLLEPEALVIGSSTGGPAALEEVLAGLLGRTLRCPILIAQHMPPVFTATMAARLGRLTGHLAGEARHLEPLANQIYVAPGDYHLEVRIVDGKLRSVLNQGPQRNSVRPAVDTLFETAAQTFGPKCAGIILTGMGSDGALGARAIKQAGGGMVIQNKESCVVFGMPGAVYESGAYDEMTDLTKIRQRVVSLASFPTKAGSS